MEKFNKNNQVSIVEVALLHIDTVSDYLFFINERNEKMSYYDAGLDSYISRYQVLDDLTKFENIDTYISKQEYPILEKNIYKKWMYEYVNKTFDSRKEYLTVYDIVNICLTKHTKSIVLEDNLAELLVCLIMEVYLPLSPPLQRKGIYNLAECLCDLWGASLDRSVIRL